MKKTGILKYRFCMLPVMLATTFTSLFAQESLSLDDAIKLALEKNYGLQMVKNDAEIANIQNNWGNAGRLPTVTGNAGYSFSSNNLDQRLSNGTNIKRNGANFQTENLAVTASWRIFNGYRVVAAKSRLEEQEKIANITIRQSANQLVYNVITTYLNMLRFKAQLAATQESLLLFEERKKLAENRFNIGVAGKSDFLQAVTDYNQARQVILTTENSIAQSKVQLNNLITRDPMTDFAPVDSVADDRFSSLHDAKASLDSLNPSLLVARAQLNVLLQQRREINANRLPSLSLNAGASLNNSNNSAGFTLRNTTYGPNTGITLAVPIFQGNVVKQNLRVNEIMQKTQRTQIDNIRNDLLASLAAAHNDYKVAKKNYDISVENLEVVKENNIIAMERFRKASITTVELRQTQMNLIEAQTALINARYQMKQAEADVLLISGKLVD